MSTDHIKTEAEEARRALGQVVGAVHKRVKAVQTEREGLLKQRKSVVIGARAVMQSIDDLDEPLEEEEHQLLGVLNGPTPEPPSDTSVASTPPVPPAPSVTDPAATAQVPLCGRQRYEPQPWPPAAQPSRRQHRLNVRRWGWAARTLAVIGAIIGMVAGSLSRHWPGMTGAGKTAFAIVWIIFFTGLGFCLGGWLGDWFERPNGD